MTETEKPREQRPILVVDDEEVNRDLLLRRLGRAGYAAEGACDAREALERLSRQEYELILLDYMMPEMSGIDLLRLLRGTHSASDLPVIMVTALQDSENIVEALSLGANDYITKPLDFPVALARIRSQLERKWADQDIRESQERYSLAARGAYEGIWDWDLRAGRMYLSPHWKEMIGYGPDELEGDSPDRWLSRVHRDDQARLQRDLDAIRGLDGPSEFDNEHRLQHCDGSWHWFHSRATVLRDVTGKAIRIVGSQTDITRERVFDPLTGLPNRVLFLEMADRALEQVQNEPGTGFAVLYHDLDRFKLINDSLGREAGDRLLKEVAARLDLAAHTYSHGALGQCMMARLGADEFAIMVPDVTDATRARAVAAYIQAHLHAPFEIDGRKTFTSASTGIVLSGSINLSEGSAGLIRDADTAMYEAKALGKGSIAVFDPEMRARAGRRLDLETGLQLALERDQLELHYQPKVDMASGRVAGFEALLRWRHPVRGMVPPTQFITIAEETGLIVPIGRWAIRKACLDALEWRKEEKGRHVTVSVNLSVRQFQEENLVEQVKGILEETGFDPSWMSLEVTESVLAGDSGTAVGLLKSLKALGIRLDIDDFGTGYSSLSYLATLPFDTIKIDRSFVSNMLADESSLEVVKMIIALARALGKHVVAEGIETADEFEMLRSLGCELGQGYLFSKPVEPQRVPALIRSRN